MRVAATGHVELGDEIARLVLAAITDRLRGWADSGIHGITCLARGADRLFAQSIVSVDGTFEVVLPAQDYRRRMLDDGDATFEELLTRATEVHTLPFARSSRRAYFAASEVMLSRCDVLFAVWDGRPSSRVGDTAHVVATARALDMPIEIFWPQPNRCPP